MTRKERTQNSFLHRAKIYFSDKHILLLIPMIIVLFIFFSVLKPEYFLGAQNFYGMGAQVAVIGFFSLAMMVTFLSSGIDLSIVSMANISSIVLGYMMLQAAKDGKTGSEIYWLIVLAFVIAIGLGILMGAINGLLISKFKLSPLLATLGTMNLYTGIAIILTKAQSLGGFPAEVIAFGNGRLLGIPIPLIVFIVIVIISAILLNKTKFGIDLRFYGTNAVASYFSGIKNNIVTLKVYIYSGILSAIAGLEMMARTNSAKAGFGTSYIFTAILCVIIGGVSPSGGKGKISGLLLAIVLLQILTTGFNLLNMDSVLIDFIWGVMLLTVMVLDYVFEKKTPNIRKQIKGTS